MSPVKIIEREIFDRRGGGFLRLVDFHGTAESRNDFLASEPVSGCAGARRCHQGMRFVMERSLKSVTFSNLSSPLSPRANIVIYGFCSLMQDTGICI